MIYYTNHLTIIDMWDNSTFIAPFLIAVSMALELVADIIPNSDGI